MTTKVRRVDLSPDEWIAGCQGLSEEEEGIYMRLTTRMYSRGGPLQLDGLAAYCGSDPRKFWRIVRQLWAKNKVIIRDQNGWDIEPTSRGDLAKIGGTLAIHRCEVELKLARDRSEIGAKLARKRWKNNNIIDAVPHMRARTANHQPSTIKKENRNMPELRSGTSESDSIPAQQTQAESLSKSQSAKSRTKTVDPEGFAEFWDAYPRHEAKGRARVAFVSARRKASLDDILAGARRYAALPGRKPEFTKHPTTWLTGECWDDEPLMRAAPKQAWNGII
jgi:hypothetical protein